MKLLILGSAILAIDVTETATEVAASDIIYPKQTIEGYQIVDVDAPDDFSSNCYEYLDGVIVKKQVNEVVPVPQSITPRQIRLALTAMGLRATVEDYITASSGDLKDWYEYSLSFDRTCPSVDQVGAELGVPSSVIDALWVMGEKL